MKLTNEQDAHLRAVQVKALGHVGDDLTWIQHRLAYRRLTKAQRRAARNRLAETLGTLQALLDTLYDEPPAWLLPQ